jgi:hypothetical protein
MKFEESAIIEHIKASIGQLPPESEPTTEAAFLMLCNQFRQNIAVSRDKAIRSASIREAIGSVFRQCEIDTQATQMEAEIPELFRKKAIIDEQLLRCHERAEQERARSLEACPSHFSLGERIERSQRQKTVMAQVLDDLSVTETAHQRLKALIKTVSGERSQRAERLLDMKELIGFFTSEPSLREQLIDHDEDAAHQENVISKAPNKVKWLFSLNFPDTLSRFLWGQNETDTLLRLQEIRKQYEEICQQFTQQRIIGILKEGSKSTAIHAFCDQQILCDIRTQLSNIVDREIPQKQRELEDCVANIARINAYLAQNPHAKRQASLQSRKKWTERLQTLTDVLGYLSAVAICLSIVLAIATLVALDAGTLSGAVLLSLAGGCVGSFFVGMGFLNLSGSVQVKVYSRMRGESTDQNRAEDDLTKNGADLTEQTRIKQDLENSIGSLRSRATFFEQKLSAPQTSSSPQSVSSA